MTDTFVNIHGHQKSANSFCIYNLGVNFSELKNHSTVSIGIHPWHIDENNFENTLTLIKKYATEKNVVAIGECGLDKAIEIDLKIQENIFKAQIKIAEEINKPLIIHCVKAFDDLIRIKKEMKISVPMIVHGFNNNVEIAKQLIKNDFYISLGKALMIENSNAQKIISFVQKEKLFLETDDSNINIEEIYNTATKLLNIDLQELKKIIFENYQQLFLIKK